MSESTNFVAGDVVQLKSGGPAMTVKYSASENWEDKGKIRCEWFEGTTKKWGDFVPATVTEYVPIRMAVA